MGVMKLVYCESCQGNHNADYGVCVAVRPRRQLRVESTPGEAFYRVAVFSLATIPAHYLAMTDDELAARLTSMRASSSGPGRWFSTEPFVRRMKRNLVIRQFVALDI